MIGTKSPQQQQQEVQMMFDTAFENRMKAKEYDHNVEDLLSHFKLCLFNYSMNSLKFTSEQVKDILFKDGSNFTYFQVGCMLQVVKGASLTMNNCNIVNVVEFMKMIEGIDAAFGKFANQAMKDSEREVKTKIELLRK